MKLLRIKFSSCPIVFHHPATDFCNMRYYLTKEKSDLKKFDVHAAFCFFLPPLEDRIDIGDHENCSEALKAASELQKDVNGCSFCARDCHKR